MACVAFALDRRDGAMNRSLQLPGAVALALLLAPPAAALQEPAGDSIAPIWAVHIDEVLPDKAAEFERLNIAENKGVHAILLEHGQPIKPVFEIVGGGSVYMSLRPKLSLAELDAPSTVPDDVSKLVAAVTDPLDTPIHASLRFHHNEIWRYQKSDSYLPAAPRSAKSAPGYIQIVSERVIPGMEDRYGAMVDSLRIALGKIRYSWPVLVFFSSYGDGAYKFLWQADSKTAFLEAGDRSAVLTAAFGRKAARQMLDDWQSCLAGSETVEATARRDFTDLPEPVPWPGLPPR
jgi:hypothetical protein